MTSPALGTPDYTLTFVYRPDPSLHKLNPLAEGAKPDGKIELYKNSDGTLTARVTEFAKGAMTQNPTKTFMGVNRYLTFDYTRWEDLDGVEKDELLQKPQPLSAQKTRDNFNISFGDECFCPSSGMQ